MLLLLYAAAFEIMHEKFCCSMLLIYAAAVVCCCCCMLLLYAVTVVSCYILLLLYTAAVVSFCFYYFYYKLRMHTYAVTVIMHKKFSRYRLFIYIKLFIYIDHADLLLLLLYCSAYCIATALIYFCYCFASYMHYSNDYPLYCCHGKILLSAAFFIV